MFIITLILLLLLAIYGVLIAYYRGAWKAIAVYTPSEGRPLQTPITVLVPARNEEKNIGACLDSLSRQSYPADLVQVIVIDDHSTDGTWEILSNRYYPDLEMMCLQLADPLPQAGDPEGPPIKAHKKFAIETGIGVARGELIVTTDADCHFHPDWLRTIAAFYEETGAKFIAAPVRIAGGQGGIRRAGGQSFLSLFQTLDFITLQGITGAAVSKRFHSMCNGANLAYEKKAFYEVGGFRGIDSIPSGDDMLLMHKIYLKYPDRVFFLKSRQAIVDTKPETSWKGLFHQRVRWASKAGHYDDKRIFWVLVLVYGVNLVYAGLLVAACWNSWWLFVLLLLLVVKTTVEYPFVRLVAAFFGQQDLLVYFPWLQPLHIAYTIVVGWFGQFGTYRWKDRKISKG
jgi:cellulose synthase/poly-beta-1,6-N-acetylglucosamine synthase-like glycosyltransferase